MVCVCVCVQGDRVSVQGCGAGVEQKAKSLHDDRFHFENSGGGVCLCLSDCVGVSGCGG